MKSFLKVLKYFLIWRITLFIPVIVAGVTMGYGTSYPFFELNYYQRVPDFLNKPFLTVWFNFDGVHYMNIATRGYIDEARFFPLLPLLIKTLSLGNLNFVLTYLVSLLIPSSALLIALLLLHKLLKLDYDPYSSNERNP